MYGYEGNDSLTGTTSNDLVDGGSGSDTLSGSGGNDTLIGGTGNDMLYGYGTTVAPAVGNDTYRFSAGDGVDVINDDSGQTVDNDVIAFTDLASTALRSVERSGSNLVIKYGDSDQVTVLYHFSGARYAVEQIKFSDGVTWGASDIAAAAAVKGTAGNDTLSASYTDSVRMYGYDGNDSLTGTQYNDLIDGGSGSDTLTGAGGNDTLIGGTGNDILYGYGTTVAPAAGDDTYRFSTGDGVDVINDDSGQTVDNDVIAFTDVASTAVRSVERSGSNLVVKYGESDQVTVLNHFAGSRYAIELIEFSDGVVWGTQAINASVSAYGTAANDEASANTNVILVGMSPELAS
jgi:Ca2+-binding RTX toxin-like protein